MYRMGALAAVRSRVKSGSAIGVMITASHNPDKDNGVKLVDPKGEMLEQTWEKIATEIANASDNDLDNVFSKLCEAFNVSLESDALVYVGRDTRSSSLKLSEAVLDGVRAMNGRVEDFGVVSTPQLHFNVLCKNTNGAYGKIGEQGYYEKIAGAFNKLRGANASNGNYEPKLMFDGANGVGALKMREFLKHLKGLNMEILNDGSQANDVLNFECGSDFVKVNQAAARGLTQTRDLRCVSVDGDADRLIYFFNDSDGKFNLLDGDRMATLIAGYFKKLLSEAGLDKDVKLGLVQTAYANGASTKYIEETLGVPVACVPTGVKHLHHKAQEEFDIGVYFEANGHGTVVISDKAEAKIKEAKNERLMNLIDVINQSVGDAIPDLLLVESILHANGWSAKDWSQCYRDYPNRLAKVKVKDRTAITTTDAERKVVTPTALQPKIDSLVNGINGGRSFVRPSGTEDVVRVYAEAENEADCKVLCKNVVEAVFELAGGVQ